MTLVTPVVNGGNSFTVTTKFSVQAADGQYYFLSFVVPTTSMPAGNFPANSCNVVFYYGPQWNNSFAALGPDSVGSWPASWPPSLEMVPGSLPGQPASVSNVHCTLWGDQGGSSFAIQGDGTLQLTLRVDFNPSTILGALNLEYAFLPSYYSAGPYWIGPVIQGGTTAVWVVGALGGPDVGNFVPGSPYGAYHPVSMQIYNFTRFGDTVFEVGDSYHIDVTGPPGSSLVVTRTLNGSPASTLNLSLDSSGHWTYDGVQQASEQGFWTETWTVNGVSTGLRFMAVIPQGGSSNYTHFTTSGDPISLRVGDQYQFDVYGAPNSTVWRNYIFNGAVGRTQIGTTDSSGHWIYYGSVQASEVGKWTQAWAVGPDPTVIGLPVLQFWVQ